MPQIFLDSFSFFFGEEDLGSHITPVQPDA